VKRRACPTRSAPAEKEPQQARLFRQTAQKREHRRSSSRAHRPHSDGRPISQNHVDVAGVLPKGRTAQVRIPDCRPKDLVRRVGSAGSIGLVGLLVPGGRRVASPQAHRSGAALVVPRGHRSIESAPLGESPFTRFAHRRMNHFYAVALQSGQTTVRHPQQLLRRTGSLARSVDRAHPPALSASSSRGSPLRNDCVDRSDDHEYRITRALG